jgi:uncharacterized protein YutD
MVNEHICYNLNVEWHGLNMMFTNISRGQPTEIFDNNSVLRFINSSESAFPFTFTNVIYNSIDFNNNCLSNVNNYIENYINYETAYSMNFLASHPFDDTRIIVRDRDLITFPKYFEGWKIESITNRTDQKHLNQFTSIHHHNFANIGIELTFAELVEFTLIVRLMIAQNPCPMELIDNYAQMYNNKGILMRYVNNYYKYNEWESFCYNLLRFNNCRLQAYINCVNNGNYWRPNHVPLEPDYKTKITNIQNLKQFLDGIELFCERFDGLQEQEELFVGMPIKLDRRSIFYTL